MSEILVDNLTGKTAAGSIVVYGEGGTATTNLQQGLAKCFLNRNYATDTTGDSFNISSVADNTTGKHTKSFTNNMSSVNYTLSGGASFRDVSNDGNSILVAQRRVSTAAITTSSMPMQFTYYGATGNLIDPNLGTSLTHGDLA